MPPADWPVGKCVVHFLDGWLLWEGPVPYEWCLPWTGVLPCKRKQVEQPLRSKHKAILLQCLSFISHLQDCSCWDPSGGLSSWHVSRPSPFLSEFLLLLIFVTIIGSKCLVCTWVGLESLKTEVTHRGAAQTVLPCQFSVNHLFLCSSDSSWVQSSSPQSLLFLHHLQQ